MADWIAVTALIIGVILLIIIIAIIIVYFFDRNLILQGGLPWSITQGSATNTSFSPNGNNIFNTVNGMTNLNVTKPNNTSVNGKMFIVNNLGNSSAIGVTGIQGVIVNGIPVGPTASGTYVWNSESTVIRVG